MSAIDGICVGQVELKLMTVERIVLWRIMNDKIHVFYFYPIIFYNL